MVSSDTSFSRKTVLQFNFSLEACSFWGSLAYFAGYYLVDPLKWMELILLFSVARFEHDYHRPSLGRERLLELQQLLFPLGVSHSPLIRFDFRLALKKTSL